jgi:hypothetical protein
MVTFRSEVWVSCESESQLSGTGPRKPSTGLSSSPYHFQGPQYYEIVGTTRSCFNKLRVVCSQTSARNDHHSNMVLFEKGRYDI